MTEVPSPHEQVVVVGDFPFFTPDELFLYWVSPDFLKLWWPQEAYVEAELGGKYRFAWPDMDWHLSGEYTSFAMGKHLGFTWSWSHDPPDLQNRQVDVYFAATEEGTRMAIFHGPFGKDEDVDRRGILEGWIHFGMRLAGLRRLAE